MGEIWHGDLHGHLNEKNEQIIIETKLPFEVLDQCWKYGIDYETSC